MRTLTAFLMSVLVIACGGGGGSGAPGPLGVGDVAGVYTLESFHVDWQGKFGEPEWVAPGVHTEATVSAWSGALELDGGGTFALTMDVAGGWDYSVSLAGTFFMSYIPSSGVSRVVLAPVSGGEAAVGVALRPGGLFTWVWEADDTTAGEVPPV